MGSAAPLAPPGVDPPSPFGDQPPFGDPVLDAAANCIRRKGIDNSSLEEVAIEAGVSRTTLYRRFGNRDRLFQALLLARAQPFQAWSRGVLLGPGTPAERLETVLAAAILEMQRVGWLDRSLHAGMSAASVRLFKSVYAANAADGVGPLLASLMDARADAAPVTGAELLDWIADQMIVLASGPRWDEDTLRSRLRFFVMPVLVPRDDADPDALAGRLARIEGKLDRLSRPTEDRP